MMAFGKSLKEAREAKGLTIAQMAETTHLPPTTITELETEDFSRIAAPIYGRGFVKLYCEAVDLDPKPFTAEFMEIFSGNRDTGIKERPVVADAPETPAEEPTPTEEPTPSGVPFEHLQPPTDVPPVRTPVLSRQQDLFGNLSEPDEPAPPSEPAAYAPPPDSPSLSMPPPSATPSEPHAPTSIATNDHAYSRYAAPLHQLKPIIRSPLWRVGLLAVIALGMLTLLAFGIRALYRATMTPPGDDPRPSEVQTSPKPAAKPDPKPAAMPDPKPALPKTNTTTRTPQSIPSLYVD